MAQVEAEDRRRWTGTLLNQAHACGLKEMRVANRIDGGNGAKNWYSITAPTSLGFHLKAVLPNQIAFDLGDNQPDGTPTPWETTRAYADAIHAACTRLGIPFLSAPSGGKGWHVEVYLDATGLGRSRGPDMTGCCIDCCHPHPEGPCHETTGLEEEERRRCACRIHVAWRRPEDPRWQIARRILAEAHQILYGDKLWNQDGERLRIRFDALFIAPNPGSYLLTEFGERKAAGSPRRKVLWHEGAGPAPPLPGTQAEAYRVAEENAQRRGTPRPTMVPVAVGAERFDTQWVTEQYGAGAYCPQSRECLAPTDGWPTCKNCPLMDQ